MSDLLDTVVEDSVIVLSPCMRGKGVGSHPYDAMYRDAQRSAQRVHGQRARKAPICAAKDEAGVSKGRYRPLDPKDPGFSGNDLVTSDPR